MEKSIILQERTALAYILNTPEAILSFSEDDFISETAKSFFIALDVLHKAGLEFTDRNVAIEALKTESSLDERAIEAIRSEPFGDTSSAYLIDSLRVSKAQYQVKELLERELLTEVSRKSFDLEKVNSIRDQLDQKINDIKSEKIVIYDGKAFIDEYEQRIIPRQEGRSFYDTGDFWLNEHLTEGFAPGKITTLFASSGIGKSSYALHLVNSQINKQIPSIYFSLEMDLVSTMDRIIAQRNRIPIYQLMPQGEDDGLLDAFLQKEKLKFYKNKLFRFVENAGLSIADIRKVIQRTKREMGVNYLVITIDLLTMVKEFNKSQSKANDYEHAMNMLHELAKDEGVHILGVVQSRRPSDKVSVNELEDLEKFRPSIEMIKNSGAIEERSRTILSAFRKKHYAERYFPDSPELELVEDVLEIQVLKQNMGHIGSIIPYLFDAECSNLTKYTEEDL